jgi:hypothetical protein
MHVRGILCPCEKISARLWHGARFSKKNADISGTKSTMKNTSELASYTYIAKLATAHNIYSLRFKI